MPRHITRGSIQLPAAWHAVTDAASAPLDRRLYLPESWDDEAAATDQGAAATGRGGPGARSPTPKLLDGGNAAG